MGLNEGHTGPLWANEGLFLAGKQIDFLTEFIRQENQLADSFGVHRPGPLMARNLKHIGIDHVDTGVHCAVQPWKTSFELIFLNQVAKIGCAVQPG